MYPAYFKVDHEEIEDKIKSLKEQLRNIPIELPPLSLRLEVEDS
ncbi:hypothetical protein DZB94_16240 [Bacillus sp. AW]|nr:hypothetical protein DZB94_16240 [Bacillus sp. AW]SCN41805.1 Protein of unknown function [Bacillus wiedmannii]